MRRASARGRGTTVVGAVAGSGLGAALVLGAVLGFGAAFFGEIRQPRLADAAEAERALICCGPYLWSSNDIRCLMSSPACFHFSTSMF